MRITYLVCYDIADDKRLRRVFKLCKNYGDHLQFSIFECDLSATEKVRFETSLKDWACFDKTDRENGILR